VTAATGISATTWVLALNKLISSLNTTQVPLVTPYMDDVQRAIVRWHATTGLDCRIERHLRQSHSAGFANIPVSRFDDMVGELVASGAKHVSVFCIELKVAERVAFWRNGYATRVSLNPSSLYIDLCNVAIVSGHQELLKGGLDRLICLPGSHGRHGF
jgi:maleate isomerase